MNLSKFLFENHTSIYVLQTTCLMVKVICDIRQERKEIFEPTVDQKN